jgi:hypothetical protein
LRQTQQHSKYSNREFSVREVWTQSRRPKIKQDQFVAGLANSALPGTCSRSTCFGITFEEHSTSVMGMTFKSLGTIIRTVRYSARGTWGQSRGDGNSSKISMFLDEQDANGNNTIHTMAAMVLLKVSRAHNPLILLLATSFGRLTIRPIDNRDIGIN